MPGLASVISTGARGTDRLVEESGSQRCTHSYPASMVPRPVALARNQMQLEGASLPWGIKHRARGGHRKPALQPNPAALTRPLSFIISPKASISIVLVVGRLWGTQVTVSCHPNLPFREQQARDRGAR